MHSELKIMCFDTGGPFHEIIRFCNENSIDILKLELPSKIRVLKNLITERSFSLQESLYYSNTIKEQINKFCSEFQPNYVYCDMIRTGVNLRDINVPVIMDFDDLLSVRYNKLLKENRSFIGTYSKVFGLVRYIEPLIRKAILKYESSKMEQSEEFWVNKAEKVVFTSPAEAALFSDARASIHSISQCVPILDDIVTPNFTEFKQLMFLGNLKTSQNLASFEFIIASLTSQYPFGCPYVINVVGEVPKELYEKYHSTKFIKFWGFVEDISDVSRNCFASICFVSFGTGVKTKVLDSISLGLPVVANEVGVEGLGLMQDVHYLHCDSCSSLIEQIDALRENRDLCLYLTQNASTYLMQHHSVDVTENKYKELIHGKC